MSDTPKDNPRHHEHAIDIEADADGGKAAKRKAEAPNDPLALVGKERVVVTQEDNDRLRRLTDKHILTVVAWVYFLQILDKSVLGLGNVWGLSEDTHLHGSQYSTVSIMNAIAQLAAQPFSAYLIVRVPARLYMSILCFCWGTAQACMAASTSFGGLVATRFLLGVFEAGCLPLFGMLTSQWYRRSEQPVRVAVWYSTNGLATIAGALLSWALGHVHSHAIAPWQLIFIIVGVVTVLTAPVVWFVIDSDITTARFFDEHDKAMAIERLRANQTGAGSHEFKWAQVWEMCYDPKTILWLAISMLLNIGASVTNAFGPTLIKGFGFDASISTLLNMPFGALQFIFILAASYAAHMWHIKSAVLAIFIIPVIVGLALLYNEGLKGSRGGTYSQGPALAGYYLLSFLFGGNPLIVSWMAANTAGQTKKSSIMSLYNAGSAAGNIIGPVLFNDRDKPHFLPGLRAVLGIFAALLGVIGLQVFVLFGLNKKREAQRVALGMPKKIVDTSMLDKYQAYDGDDDKGLSDATDFQNPKFVYLY